MKKRLNLDSLKGNFFLLPNDIHDHDLSNKEFVILSYLVRCKDKNNQCWPSRATIGKKSKTKSLVTVDKCLKSLEQKGYIHKMYQYDHSGKGQLSNIYFINKFD